MYQQISQLATKPELLLDVLRAHQGYYHRPRTADGSPVGPLVAYAKQYEPGKHYVGEEYANCAKLEENPTTLEPVVWQLLRLPAFETPAVRKVTVCCGMPLGGMTLAYEIARQLRVRYCYLEKKIKQVATDTEREQSSLVFNRHDIRADDQVLIVEDVCNNFSTAAKAISAIQAASAQVLGIVCLLNRSPDVEDEYIFGGPPVTECVPVIALLRHQMPQWRQDDPQVAHDVANGNVEWNPKTNWHRLEEAMQSVR